MKPIQRQTKRPYIFKAAIAVLAAGLVLLTIIPLMESTHAELPEGWLTSIDLRENDISVKQLLLDVQINEDFDEPSSVSPAEPGATITKEAWVENSGDIPAFVRVMVLPTLVAMDGVTFLETPIIYENLNTTDWKDGGDGYYYYLDVLEPGGATPPLFDAVAMDPDIGSAYPQAKLTVTLLCETVEIGKYHYRKAWWPDNPGGVGLPASLALVDGVLSALAR